MAILVLTLVLEALVSLCNAGEVRSTIHRRQNDLPTVTLPYGTWKASKYDSKHDVYTFSNIRYAAPPIGSLRWAKPAPPTYDAMIQTGESGRSCYQPSSSQSASSQPLSLQNPDVMSSNEGSNAGKASNPAPSWFSQLPNWISSLLNSAQSRGTTSNDNSFGFLSWLSRYQVGSPDSEDCLFLEVIVPGKAFRGETVLPVVNHIQGGSYIIGGKNPIYDGIGLVKHSDGNLIYISANFRQSVFGFLSGTTVETDPTTVPNAGLWDQRAALEWIQKYIGLFGGDRENVNLWGEGAGAGSILHHVVAFSGKQPGKPLFKKVLIQSPWSIVQYNRTGSLEEQFRYLKKATGCASVSCLRGQSAEAIKKAADGYASNDLLGHFSFRDAVDNDLVRQIPDVDLSFGNVVRGIESVLVIHNSDQPPSLIAEQKQNKTIPFDHEILGLYNDPTIQQKIMQRYPPIAKSHGKYVTEKDRIADYMKSSYSTCHVRSLARGFHDRIWVGRYARKESRSDNMNSLQDSLSSGKAHMEPDYHDYLINHAIWGDPNMAKDINSTIKAWPKTYVGKYLDNVMDFGNQEIELIVDPQASEIECDFWLDIWSTAMRES